MKQTKERIINLIGETPRTARDLSTILGISLPTISNHLKDLQTMGPPIGFSLVRQGLRGLPSKQWFLIGGSHVP